MRIAFFGDGPWATGSLSRLLADGHDIPVVVLRTRPTSSCLADLAGAEGIPLLQPARVNEPGFVQEIAVLKPDVCLSVSYDQIFHGPIITLAPKGLVNCHAGMLPRYRGRNPLNWAIINGEKEVGITAHCVDEHIDTGGILLQRSVPVGETDDYRTVLRNVVSEFPHLVADAMRGLAAGDLQPTPQPRVGAYFCQRVDGDEWLDWASSSQHIYNKIRAISPPGPGARTCLGDQVVAVTKAEYQRQWPTYIATPGQVVDREADVGVYVKTGDSLVLVREVRIDDADPRVPTWRVGTRLGFDPVQRCLQLQRELCELREELSHLAR